jgi:ABC-type amino acid transport substrate-binding protein
MHRGTLLLAGLLLAPAVASLAAAEPCNPYPVGRCGAFNRENVIFCFDTAAYARDHSYVSATDADAVVIGTAAAPPPPMQLPTVDGTDLEGVYTGANVAYVRLAPAQGFAADPYNADLPTRSVWLEANHVPGLQTRSASCATFQWWAECHAWMGPLGNVFEVGPDAMVV